MSNHPTQHKYAAVRFLFNRLNSYDLQEKEYQQELNVIHNILYNNSLPTKPPKHIIHTKTQQQMTKPTKCKWATFTYVGKETSYIRTYIYTFHRSLRLSPDNRMWNMSKNKQSEQDIKLLQCENLQSYKSVIHIICTCKKFIHRVKGVCI